MNKSLFFILYLIISTIPIFSEINQFDFSTKKGEDLNSDLIKYTWIVNPWQNHDYSTTEIKFNGNTGTLYIAKYTAEDSLTFKYSITEDVITIHQIKNNYPNETSFRSVDIKYQLFSEIRIDGPVVLKLITADRAGKFPLEVFAKELQKKQIGTRVFENYSILWGDVPVNYNKYSDIFLVPDISTPYNLNYSLGESVIYSEKHFNNFKETEYCTISIDWLGSSIYKNKKWFLGYLTADDGNKDGKYERFVWTTNSVEYYPSIIFDYYENINQKRLNEAYSIWHKKRDFDYFKSLYEDIQKIIPKRIVRLSRNDWEVRSEVMLNNSTIKYYKTKFTLNSTNIVESFSTEITINQMYE